MTSLEKNLRFYLGCKIGNLPSLFWLNYHRKQFQEKIISKETDICIEGFQRSGNSFFFRVFKKYNREVAIAHHIHASVQILKAIDYKIPAVVLIRKPADAIASLLTWDHTLRLDIAIRAYVDFYKTLLPYKNDVVLAKFEEATSNPSWVIDVVNRRFDTDFIVPDLNAKDLEELKLNLHNRQSNKLISPVPNSDKELLNQKNKQLVTSHSLFKHADKIYHSFVNQ